MGGNDPARSARSVLAVAVARQEKSNWCWAAIACSVARYYGIGTYRQADVAAGLFDADGWNVIAPLDEALAVAGCAGYWSPGRPAFERIGAEIDAGRPLGVCIQWPTGPAHYVLITGCFRVTREIYVDDPLHGRSVQPFADFPMTYHGLEAVWRGVYWTSPAPQPASAERCTYERTRA